KRRQGPHEDGGQRGNSAGSLHGCTQPGQQRRQGRTVLMADVTIVGLGPGPAGQRTVAAQKALDSARTIFARSHADTDFGDLLTRPNVVDIATMRDANALPGARWSKAATAVVEAAGAEPVVLAVPGHPRFGEMLTVETIRMAEANGLSVEVI